MAIIVTGTKNPVTVANWCEKQGPEYKGSCFLFLAK